MRFKLLIVGLICFFLVNCSAYYWKNLNPNKRRQEYIQANPKIDNTIKETILNGGIILGMTPSQVVASRGAPFKVNRTTGEYGIHEQWVMFAPGYLAQNRKEMEYGYIYFENGKVTSWQSK